MKIFTLIIFLFSYIQVYSQGKDSFRYIKLNIVPVDSALATSTEILTRIIDSQNIKNIPKEKHLSSLRFLILNNADWLNSYKNGDSTNNGWFIYKNPDLYNIQNASSEFSPMKASKFAVFVTLDTISNIKYFIIDANNNLDFADDTLMTAYMDSSYRYSPFTSTIQYQLMLANGTIREYTIPLKIKPYQNIDFKNDPLSKKVGISVSYDRGLKGIYNTTLNSYIFATNIPFFGLYYELQEKTRIVVTTTNKEGLRIDEQWYYIGDSLNINNDVYKIDRLNRETNTLELHFIKPTEYGFSAGNKIKPLSATDFVSEKRVDFSFTDNEYLLLDFWGSWCIPCIQAIPKLKKLIDSNPIKVKAISFAYDEVQDSAALRKIIIKNKMNWNHVWVNRNESKKEDIINQLKIDAFPTFILVDRKGNIVYRGLGEDALDTLSKLID